MAKSDMLVRMKADTSGYDANIAKARRTLEGFKQDNLSIGGILNQTTKSLAAAAAGYLSLSAAASTIKEVVSQSIEMAKAGEGIRIAFERLNNPALLDGLREATHGTVTDIELMKAAVKFNDFKLPLDQLGTMLAFAQQKAKDTGQSVDYMVDSIVTGLGRKSLMILDNLGLSAAQIKEKMAETGDMTKAVGEIIREQMADAGDYIETAAEKAIKADVELKNAMTALGETLMPLQEQGTAAFSAIEIEAVKLLNEGIAPLVPKVIALKENIGDLYDTVVNNPISTGVWDWLVTGYNITSMFIPKLQLLKGLLSESVSDKVNRVAGFVGGLVPDNSVTKIPEVVVNGNTPKKKTKTTSTISGPTQSDFEKFLHKSTFNVDSLKGSDIPEMMSVWATMSDETKNKFLDLSGAVVDMNESFDNLKTWSEDFDLFAQLQKELQQERMAFDMAAQSAQNFGAALAGLEDPGIKAAGTVLQAIASIALGFAQASVQASLLGPIGWMAWLVAGTSALAQTVSMVHSITGFANGGEIKGNSYSGDNIMAQGPDGGLIGLNAGEIVLNKAGQASIASQLQNQGRQQSIVGVVKGENIVLVANRYLKRSGQGELVTWGN